jgi:hypothetical protein
MRHPPRFLCLNATHHLTDSVDLFHVCTSKLCTLTLTTIKNSLEVMNNTGGNFGGGLMLIGSATINVLR